VDEFWLIYNVNYIRHNNGNAGLLQSDCRPRNSLCAVGGSRLWVEVHQILVVM